MIGMFHHDILDARMAREPVIESILSLCTTGGTLRGNCRSLELIPESVYPGSGTIRQRMGIFVSKGAYVLSSLV